MSRVYTYPSILVVLSLVVWLFYNPLLASWVFLVIAYGVFVLLLLYDRGAKPHVDTTRWTKDESRVIQKYHIFIRGPLTSQIASANLNIFRISVLIWVPLLLWKGLLIQSALAALFYFLPFSLTKKLEPFNPAVKDRFQYRTDAMKQLAGDKPNELDTLREVLEKMRAGNH
jgi:hypothetical protein